MTIDNQKVEKLGKKVYDLYINEEISIRKDEKRSSYSDANYIINLVINDTFIEFAIYENKNYDQEMIVQLCYLRYNERFIMEGNYKPLVKYISSMLSIETLSDII